MQRGAVYDNYPDAVQLIDAILNGDSLEVETRLSTFQTSPDGCDPKTGWTPLHAAAWVKSDEITKMLIKYDAEVNRVDVSGQSVHCQR